MIGILPVLDSTVSQILKLDEERQMVEPFRLQVYTSNHCFNCHEARRLARVAAQTFPELVVEVIDVDRAPARLADVYAVPTYVLNDRICFLGNPSPQDLCAFLRQWLENA
jgi:hypothetical protein